MTQDPLGGMESLREVAFTDALLRMQEMLGCEVKLKLNQFERFLGLVSVARLERMETLPPGHRAVRLAFDNGTTFFPDPDEVCSWLGGGFSVGLTWIEFQVPDGPIVALERPAPCDGSDIAHD
ncbi:MAG: hypothetical protein ACRDPE_11910 [Solirubrobacterales bacterium]